MLCGFAGSSQLFSGLNRFSCVYGSGPHRKSVTDARRTSQHCPQRFHVQICVYTPLRIAGRHWQCWQSWIVDFFFILLAPAAPRVACDVDRKPPRRCHAVDHHTAGMLAADQTADVSAFLLPSMSPESRDKPLLFLRVLGLVALPCCWSLFLLAVN